MIRAMQVLLILLLALPLVSGCCCLTAKKASKDAKVDAALTKQPLTSSNKATTPDEPRQGLDQQPASS